jgi:AcrR family transcriptional regulator
MTANETSDGKVRPRERILDTAYQLIARPSKNDLVLAVLEHREQVWTLGLVEAEARRRGGTPEERLLAVFDVFDEWFRSDGFDTCTFVNVLLEMRPDHVLGVASIRHLQNIRTMIAQLATEAGLRDPEEFARSWHILMKGSIVSAAEGDTDAALRAQAMAASLIDQHR